MLDQVLELFIKPDFDLNIMKAGQTLNDVTTSILEGLKPVLEDFKPDVMFVHGDTTTTFAVQEVAYYQQIKVGHVEAGLRTEISTLLGLRRQTENSQGIANYHFAPTEGSKDNLLREIRYQKQNYRNWKYGY